MPASVPSTAPATTPALFPELSPPLRESSLRVVDRSHTIGSSATWNAGGDTNGAPAATTTESGACADVAQRDGAVSDDDLERLASDLRLAFVPGIFGRWRHMVCWNAAAMRGDGKAGITWSRTRGPCRRSRRLSTWHQWGRRDRRSRGNSTPRSAHTNACTSLTRPCNLRPNNATQQLAHIDSGGHVPTPRRVVGHIDRPFHRAAREAIRRRIDRVCAGTAVR